MKKFLLGTLITASVTCSVIYVGHVISQIQDSRSDRLKRKMENIINNFNYDRPREELEKELNEFKKLYKKDKKLYAQAKINPFMETDEGVNKNNDIIINSFIEKVENKLNESAEYVEAEVIED